MIPVNRPKLEGNEMRYLQECIQSGWISSEGPFVKQFEEQFSAYIGTEQGIAVSNGSAALDIAVKALGIGQDDEVIMPAFTIISPAFSIVRQGAVPVLVDADPLTWNMDASQAEAKITARTKAILVVHIYGLPCDMEPILDIAGRHGLKIIEDAAEMHGQTYNGKKCGSFGDISIFSFYPNKIITTGEGGMLLTDNGSLAEKCRKFRNLSFEPDGRRFIHNDIGWNYRMTNMQAALGVAQMENIDSTIRRKRAIGKLYNQLLEPISGLVQLPQTHTVYAENIYWVYGVVMPSQEVCNRVVNYLAKEKIGTRPFFWSMHEQPVLVEMGLFEGERFPHAEKLARTGFYLPSGTGLTDDEIEIVSNTLIKAVHESI